MSFIILEKKYENVKTLKNADGKKKKHFSWKNVLRNREY
jgi:hypothetical protein